MQELTEIINVLNASEVRLIRKHYKLEAGNEHKKRLELFDLIREGIAKSNKEASAHLYHSKPGSKFSHLKSRLKADILNILLLQSGESKYSAPYRQAAFNCQKLYMAGEMLLNRGANIAGEKSLKEAAKISAEYHLTLEQIIIQDLLRTHFGFKQGLQAFKKFEDSIHDQIKLLEDIMRAKEYLINIGLPNQFYKNKEQEYQQFAENSIREIKAKYDETESPHIGYHYYYISIFYAEIKQEFKKGLDYALKFLELIEKEAAIFSEFRVATANIQIAGLLIKLEQYKRAVDYAQKGLDSYSKGSSGKLVAFEVLFFAQLYRKLYPDAENILAKAFKNKSLLKSNFQKEKWLYFKANLEFLKGEYESSIKILRHNTSLMKDKSGWYMGWQLLEILNLIELKDHDILFYRLDSFKKLLQRQKDKTNKRVKLTFRVLDVLYKQSFHYRNTFEKVESDITLLQKAEKEYSWNPLGFEIVRFDQWFYHKVSQGKGEV